jgi:hypothetical protein
VICLRGSELLELWAPTAARMPRLEPRITLHAGRAGVASRAQRVEVDEYRQASGGDAAAEIHRGRGSHGRWSTATLYGGTTDLEATGPGAAGWHVYGAEAEGRQCGENG